MRLLRRALAVSTLALLSTGCLGSGADSSAVTSPPSPTALTIVYVRGVIAQGTMTYRRSAPLTLRCSPPAGTIPAADVACFAISRAPSRYFGRSTASCIGPPLRWSVRGRGTFRGRPIRRTYDMCDFPEARSWTDLGGTKLVGIVPARAVVTVPQVAPGYVAPAVAALHADGLRVAIESVPPIRNVDASTNGYAVAHQDPEAGARVPRGTLVVLRIGVSLNGGPGGLGPAGIVPDLVGVDVNRAKSLATSNGLRVTVRPAGHPVASLMVTKQSIAAGASVQPGDTVVLTID